MKEKSEQEILPFKIELANNGIVIRESGLINEVEVYQIGEDGSDEHLMKAIGGKIYRWLIEVVLSEHNKEMEPNGFELEIGARLYGESIEKEMSWSDQLDNAELSVRALNILRNNNVPSAGDLQKLSKVDLLKMRGMGKKTFKEIVEFMKSQNLQFKKL